MTLETIFTVKPHNFERFDELGSVEFFGHLLHAEASRIGIPSSKVTISHRTKVGDKGVDAAVLDHDLIRPSNIIQPGLNTYQIKAGKSFKPWRRAKIRDELFGRDNEPIIENLGEAIKNCLDNDGVYVLVCFGSDLTPDQRSKSEVLIKDFLLDCGYSKPRSDVWGQGQLIGFLREYPSLSLIANGNSGTAQFQTHVGWSSHEHMRKDFVAGIFQKELIETIREELREENQTHIRICGPAGIGKTKLALVATAVDDLRPLVIYFDSSTTFLHSAFRYQATIRDSDISAIVVVDECNPQDRAEIWNLFAHSSSRIKFITIYGDLDAASDLQLVIVPPLEESQVAQIIEGYGIPADQARRWAVVCDGYPRVAHMVGWNLINNPEDILRPPAAVNVWDRFIAGGDDLESEEVYQRRLVLRYLALFKKFGYSGDVQSEAQAIAELIRQDNPAITWGNFQRIVNSLRKRKILQGEKTLYISPKLLHIMLWIEWWNIYGENADLDRLLETLPCVSDDWFLEALPSTLIDWFFEMFEYAAGSKAASRTIRDLLGEPGPFQRNPEMLKTERGARLFRLLGEVEPAAAIRCLERTLGKWNVGDLQNFTAGRHHIVWLLEKTARWRKLFKPSARLLLTLAEAENETWGNNASGVFAGLFSVSVHPQLSVSEAPPEERWLIIEEAINAVSRKRRLLAIKACEQALRTKQTGSIPIEPQVFGKQPEGWTPQTYGELFDVYRQAWRLLVETLDKSPKDEQQEVIDVLLRNMRRLGKNENLVDMIIDTAKLISSEQYVDNRKVLEVAIHVLHYDKGRLSEKTREKWRQLKEELTGTDFASLLRRYVGMSIREDSIDAEGNIIDQINPEIVDLAQQVIENPSLLLAELEWLTTDHAINSYQYGYILGQKDAGFSLLWPIVEAQRVASSVDNLFFLGGYLRAIQEEDSVRWEKHMDAFAEDNEMRIWIPELTRRAGSLSDRAAMRILRLIRQQVIGSECLVLFQYGLVVQNLSEDIFTEWIEFLLSCTDDHAIYTAIPLYHIYYEYNGSRHNLPEDLTFRLLTNANLFRKMPTTLVQRGIMESYHWDQIARTFIGAYPEKCSGLAEVIIEHFGEEGTIFEDDHNGPQVILTEIVEICPEEAWARLEEHIGPPIDSRAFHLTRWLRGRDDFDGTLPTQPLGALSAIPPHLVWKWVENDPEKHAWYLAHFVPRGLYRNKKKICWAREVLVRYGEREDVRNELMANFSTEGWSGPMSLHLQRKKEALLDFRKGEDNEIVRLWIDEYVKPIDLRIEDALLQEERQGF